MLRIFLYTALGLLPTLALASQAAGGGKAGKPAKAADAECSGDHGTAVSFHATPSDAAKAAHKEQKLVFVLHVSGDFEDPDFT